MKIKISSIETLGTHEGPGIRLVIFVQGCNYRCLYCHNPETQTLDSGQEMEIDALIEKIKKSKPYFGKSGGVTISGGEPLLQAQKLIPLFKKLKELNISTAIDTNGSILTQDVKELLKFTDLVLLDIKEIDPQKHKNITGQSNEAPLDFANYLEKNGIKFWIRYVLVPNLTDSEDDLRLFGERFKDYSCLEKVEVLPYHTLGIKKYENLGMKYQLHSKTPDISLIEKTKRILEKYFKNVAIR